jgi:hypothetical protein
MHSICSGQRHLRFAHNRVANKGRADTIVMPMTHLAHLSVYKALMRKTVIPKFPSAERPAGFVCASNAIMLVLTLTDVVTVKNYY